MGRKLTGWVRKRGRSFYIGFRLRSGVAWERAARDTHGASLGREDAKALRLTREKPGRTPSMRPKMAT